MTRENPARLVVLAAGNGSNLQAILDAIDGGRLAAQVVLVVSHRADAYALTRASERGIATAVQTLAAIRASGGTREDLDRWLAATVAQAAPDLVVCAGWMLILGAPFLQAFPQRVINLHPALPGTFIGKDAIGDAWQAAQRGEITQTGVMVHDVIAELDAGAAVACEAVAILPDDTLETLTARIHGVEHALLVRAIALKLGYPTS